MKRIISKFLVVSLVALFSNISGAVGTATGPNKVYIEQLGNTNVITIEQVGGTNTVAGINGSTTVGTDGVTTHTPGAASELNYATVTGSSDSLVITQHGDNNWAQYNIKGNNNSYFSTVTGDDNTTELVVGDATFTNNHHNSFSESFVGNGNLSLETVIGNYITSQLSVTGDDNQITQNLFSTNGSSTIDITGNTNVVNVEQTDVAGAIGHVLEESITGDYNSISTQQQGSNDTTINIANTGDHNTITVRSSSSSIVDPQTAIVR
jgi:hypothetical protein